MNTNDDVKLASKKQIQYFGLLVNKLVRTLKQKGVYNNKEYDPIICLCRAFYNGIKAREHIESCQLSYVIDEIKDTLNELNR